MNDIIRIIEVRKAGAKYGMEVGTEWLLGDYYDFSGVSGSEYWNDIPVSACIGLGSAGTKYVLWNAVDGDRINFYAKPWNSTSIYQVIHSLTGRTWTYY